MTDQVRDWLSAADEEKEKSFIINKFYAYEWVLLSGGIRGLFVKVCKAMPQSSTKIVIEMGAYADAVLTIPRSFSRVGLPKR